METRREQILNKLLASYKAWYNIEPGDRDSGLPLEALCIYHTRGEKYVLTKKAKIWGMETNEYLYLFSAPELEQETVEKCCNFAIEDALGRIKPHSEHMYSYITAIFVADVIEPKALTYVRRRKFMKSYRMGLQGSAPFKALALETEKEVIVTNSWGRDLKKFFKKICKE